MVSSKGKHCLESNESDVNVRLVHQKGRRCRAQDGSVGTQREEL